MDITLSNQVYKLSIPQEVADERDLLCPAKGKFFCEPDCPIYRTFFAQGVSCNGALDKFPEQCIELLKKYNKPKEEDANEK